MGSPKSNPSNLLQCLFHFIVNRSVGRCVMEKGGGKQGQGEADTLVLLHNSSIPNIMYMTKIMSSPKKP